MKFFSIREIVPQENFVKKSNEEKVRLVQTWLGGLSVEKSNEEKMVSDTRV